MKPGGTGIVTVMDVLRKSTRLMGLSIRGVAAVEHPANSAQLDGREGWIVFKADGSPDESRLSKETTVTATATVTGPEVTVPPEVSLEKAMTEAPPVIREFLAKMAADNQAAAIALDEARKTAVEALDVAKAANDARLDSEWLVKSREIYAGVETPEIVAPVMKAAWAALTPDMFNVLDRILRSAAAVVKTGAVFETQGAPGGTAPSGAFAQLVAKAAELRAADPSLSHAQALVKASDLHPALTAAYAAEGNV